ncbi:MAG: IclR family transcriptional regulator [Alphaproteobacteria bacterium]|nr:IclR family transcriptional regulator [Alphaproteobacteria bacterium]MBU2379359.1 IclR family transcriptional regulator [Alphaproteobacteria bacterium]
MKLKAIEPASDAPSRYSVPALEKGLDILELLAKEREGLNVTAIAARLSRSTGEMYRIIQYLEWRGYIDRDRERDLYTLSFRVFRLAHEHPPLKSMVACATPIMEALASEIGQSCHLVVVDRTSIVIVAQVDSPLPIRYSVRLGAQFPIHEKSSGLLLAAFMRPADFDNLVEELSRTVDKKTVASFKKHATEIRKAGHEDRESFLVPGIVNLSHPVRNHAGEVVAALTVPYLSQRGDQPSVAACSVALETAAEALSRALGYQG